MAINGSKTIVVDIDQPVKRVQIGTLVTGDKAEYVYSFEIQKDGSALDATGATVLCYMARANRTTFQWEGTVSGSTVTASIPINGHSIPGRFALAITLSMSDVAHTIAILEGDIHQKVVGAAYTAEGESQIPTTDELVALVEEMTTVANAARTATTAADTATANTNAAIANANTATEAATNAANNATDAAAAANTAVTNVEAALQDVEDALAGGVTSVNGKSGAVTLTPSDVGAVDVSDSTAYVASVNGKTGAATLDASDVGALPDSTTYVESVNGQTGAVTISDATTEASGLMSASDKIALDKFSNMQFCQGGGSATVGTSAWTTATVDVEVPEGAAVYLTGVTTVWASYSSSSYVKSRMRNSTTTTVSVSGTTATFSFNIVGEAAGTANFVFWYVVIS